MTGSGAGLTVIFLDTDAKFLPQLSVAVQVSVTVPPQTPGRLLIVDRFEDPLIKQSPLKPLLKLIVLGAGILPQATVVGASAVMVGKVAGLTVIFLETDAKFRPQLSIAVQVSTMVPPHAPGIAVKVLGFELPLIKQSPFKLLLKLIVLGAGILPQATVVGASAVMVGKVAGLTVIFLETGARLRPKLSVAVQVSTTVPPQAPGGVLKVDGFEVPLTRQPPLRPLL